MEQEKKELIIRTLEYCSSYGDCDDCPSFSKCQDHMEDCTRFLAMDAISLLKEVMN